MKLNLNNSELNTILTMIDDALTCEVEPLEKATYMSIVEKINGHSRYPVNRCVEEYAVAILNFDLEGK